MLGMARVVRYAKASGLTIANAIFMLAFFGSFAAIPHLGYRWELPWLLLIVAWSLTIRWWMVSGLFLGLLLRPIHLHVIDVGATLLWAACGALFGLAAEFVWEVLRPPIHKQPPTPSDESNQPASP
jgi:hypothetical protein